MAPLFIPRPKCSRHSLYFLFLFFTSSWTAVAQNVVSGRVIDSLTNEPLPYVNVFFANTSFGASTDANGEYRFSGFPSGKYDLIFTYVGYVMTQQSVAFTGDTRVVANQPLVQEAKLLSELLVKPDTVNWRRNYQSFKHHFLGASKNAAACEIKNPKSIFVYFDPRDAVLVAHAREPIIVENNAMGYRIKYHLHHFEYQGRPGLFTIFGLPQFEEMEPKNERERKRWLRERDRAFYGSLNHFMRAWQQQAWKENDFRVSRLYRIPNKDRPSDAFLDSRIRALRKKGEMVTISMGTAGPMEKPRVVNGDSLSYYLQLRALPKEVDSVVDESLTGKEFAATGDGLMNFRGLLQVRYKELEEPGYAAMVGRPDTRIRQRSIVHVFEPIRIYDNGYYEDVRSIFMENYWSWSEKIATLLPLEFQPQPK